MFITRLERIEGEYVVVVPHEVIVQGDLHAGQVVSIVIEPLDEYAKVDGEQSEPASARWKLNENGPSYRGSTKDDQP
jgi:hypothetical protein